MVTLTAEIAKRVTKNTLNKYTGRVALQISNKGALLMGSMNLFRIILSATFGIF